MLIDEIKKGENKRLELKEKLPSNENFEINESGNFVSIIFYRPEMPNNAEKLFKLVENEQEEKIINFLIENKKINVNQVEKLLSLKRRAREILSNLVKKGILEKIGKTKGSYYILKGINNES